MSAAATANTRHNAHCGSGKSDLASRMGEDETVTDSQRELLRYLSMRTGVVPVQKERLDDLKTLHEGGLVATHGVFACITDEGERALDAALP